MHFVFHIIDKLPGALMWAVVFVWLGEIARFVFWLVTGV